MLQFRPSVVVAVTSALSAISLSGKMSRACRFRNIYFLMHLLLFGAAVGTITTSPQKGWHQMLYYCRLLQIYFFHIHQNNNLLSN